MRGHPARVAIIGGGIGGLAAALFLARRGHPVTVFERDTRRAGGDLDGDFFAWPRPRVPQATQPHGLLSPVRAVLRDEAPDVYARMLELGAFEQHEFDWFDEHPPYREGDEDLVAIRTRRIVLETALSEAVAVEPGIDLRLGQPVEGLVMDPGGPVARITGVRTSTGLVEADLVLDAGGRRSPVVGWLSEANCRPAVVESHSVGIAYFSRWYRLRADGPTHPARVAELSFAPFAIALVFPSDNRVIAVTLAVQVADPTRGALREPAAFDAAARLFPVGRAWLDLHPEPCTDVVVMAGLNNRWTSLVDRDGPVVAGIVGIGDTITHTNPTLGQGCALTLLAARRVARTLGELPDAAAYTVDYYRWATEALKPWFDYQVSFDTQDEALLTAGLKGFAEGPPRFDDSTRTRFAGARVALDDPVVMRAKAQVRHLVATPDRAYGTDEVRAHVARWLAEHPDFPHGFEGPARAEWEAAIRQAAPKPTLTV